MTMEPIIISIAEQIIAVVVLSLLAGFAIGWLSVRAKYKAKYDYEATREFFRRKPLYEWHTSIPCPGAFLICEVEKNRLIYGYAVSDGEGVAIMQLPMCEPLTSKHLFLTQQCTNIDAVMRVPFYVKQRPVAKYKTALIIDAMPFDYMANKLNMTFEL